jgi:RNA polymerase sigma factor (TIGR02999 family)
MTGGASAIRHIDDCARDEVTGDELLKPVYEELRRLAKRHLSGQRPGHALQTTDLVNEACLKLLRPSENRWKDRIHFLALASRAMRSVLVDDARRRSCEKRGTNPIRVSLSEAEPTSEVGRVDALAVHQALSRLAVLDPRKKQVVELRCFGGHSVEEIAELLGISNRTVKRKWRWARAWLYRELQKTVDASLHSRK